MTETKNTQQSPLWNLLTICPLDIAFGLPLGFTKNSSEIIQLMNQIAEVEPSVRICNENGLQRQDSFAGAEYLSLEDDVSSVCLFIWRYENGETSIKFHVFPNHIAIAEISLNNLPAESAMALDELALTQTKDHLDAANVAFSQMLEKLSKALSSSIAIFDKKEGTEKIYWPSRMLLLTGSETTESKRQPVIHDWLAETQRPGDSKRLINGDIKESMTWLKYIIVDAPDNEDYRVDTMILAQYCYSAQEKCNRKLRQAIEWAFQGKKKKLESELQRAKRTLEKSRVISKLHNVEVNECLRHLTRPKRRLIKDIFACWEYERLVSNGEIMLDLCADKINESNSRQAKISAYKTEYILIGISLFTVLDFFFFVTQFSREAMANPTLDHNDGGPSSFLTIIANIPADLMFFVGVVAAGLIFIAYRKVKG